MGQQQSCAQASALTCEALAAHTAAATDKSSHSEGSSGDEVRGGGWASLRLPELVTAGLPRAPDGIPHVALSAICLPGARMSSLTPQPAPPNAALASLALLPGRILRLLALVPRTWSGQPGHRPPLCRHWRERQPRQRRRHADERRHAGFRRRRHVARSEALGRHAAARRQQHGRRGFHLQGCVDCLPAGRRARAVSCARPAVWLALP